MTTLIAKPIVKNQYWVVTNGREKVGNVVASGTGYELKIHGETSYFDSTKKIQKQTNIEFQSAAVVAPKRELLFTEYPTPKKIYNSMLDVRRRLHLFTKTARSKCYYAAGWFLVQGATVEPVFCPKYIFLQRYDYTGPYKSEAEAVINIR